MAINVISQKKFFKNQPDIGPALRVLLIITALFMLFGCAPVISKESLKGAQKDFSFKELLEEPQKFDDKKVLLGGTILKIENMKGFTYLEVLQQPLDSSLRPHRPGKSEGRFLIRFEGFKDPEIFKAGRRITIAGTLSGTEELFINKMPYRYPVIKPVEFHLWEKYRENGPQIGIGLGIGIVHTF